MSRLVNNRKELYDVRKDLRNFSTAAEATLWKLIKGRQLQGRKFRRQFSVDSYVLDFYCPEEKLAVELDGAHHFTPEGLQHDEKRDAFLKRRGITVLRIENEKVFKNTGQVLDYIQSHFKAQQQPTPSPTSSKLDC